jgi:Skp family chaperone for outer membrane proteins
MQRTVPTILCIAAALATASIVVLPAGGAGAVLANQTSVAVMDPSRVLEGLIERADAESGLRAKFEDLKAQANTRTSEIRSLQEQLQLTQDANAREALQNEIESKGVKAIAFDQFAARQFDVDLALLKQDLYQRIKAAVADLSQANGIDIVLVNDNAMPIQINPELKVARAAQVSEQISQRRVMFAADKVDITDELILRMNNAHNERTGQR